jgi:hypothetical protein
VQADDMHVVHQHHGNNEDDMQMTVKRFLTSVTLAGSLLISVNANATDADDKLLGSTSMRDSAMAYYAASVIAYPSICQTTLSDKMKATSARMAAKHGEALMKAVRVKLVEPDIKASRDQWCSKIGKFIKSVER